MKKRIYLLALILFIVSMVIEYGRSQDSLAFDVEYISSDSFPGRTTIGVTMDSRNGDYYMIHNNGNLYRYRSGEYTEIMCPPCGFLSFGQRNPVLNGDFLYLPFGNGLIRMHTVTEEAELVYAVSVTQGIGSIAVVHDSLIYVTTKSSTGLGMIKIEGDSITEYNTSNSEIPSNAVKQLTLGPDGRLWMYYSDGVVVFDGTDFRTYTDFEQSRLTDDFVIDQETGDVWVSMKAVGVASIIDDEITVYRVDFPSFTSPSKLERTTDGLLWFHDSNPRGLHYFDLVTRRFISFDDLGIPTDFTIRRIFMVDDLGRILLTGDFTVDIAIITPRKVVTAADDLSLPTFTLDVFPNPTTDILTISPSVEAKYINAVQPDILSVHDCLGRRIHSERLPPHSLSSGLQVDASSWPSGMYTLSLGNESGRVSTQKIIKQ